MQMKTINYRGGIVKFRIPCHWKEEYSDVEGGTFFDASSQSTLRLKVITALAPEGVTTVSALELLRATGVAHGAAISLNSGNAYATFEREAKESGAHLHIHYWVVANPVPPRHARIVTFSYTVVGNENNSTGTQQELRMLDSEIRAAQFSSAIGE